MKRMTESAKPDRSAGHHRPTRYTDQVASVVADRIRERGTVTVDELGMVAEALDCNTADLLPSHLDDGGKGVGTTHLDEALEWDDEAGTVVVRRLPWMTDKQWATVRDSMASYLEAEGFTREATR